MHTLSCHIRAQLLSSFAQAAQQYTSAPTVRGATAAPRQPLLQAGPSLGEHSSLALLPASLTMPKLYYTPTSCGAASFIAAHTAGLALECETVDIRAHKTKSGADFYGINPKGNVPALTLADGTCLNEGAAVLQWIADQARVWARPAMAPKLPPRAQARIGAVVRHALAGCARLRPRQLGHGCTRGGARAALRHLPLSCPTVRKHATHAPRRCSLRTSARAQLCRVAAAGTARWQPRARSFARCGRASLARCRRNPAPQPCSSR